MGTGLTATAGECGVTTSGTTGHGEASTPRLQEEKHLARVLRVLHSEGAAISTAGLEEKGEPQRYL